MKNDKNKLKIIIGIGIVLFLVIISVILLICSLNKKQNVTNIKNNSNGTDYEIEKTENDTELENSIDVESVSKSKHEKLLKMLGAGSDTELFSALTDISIDLDNSLKDDYYYTDVEESLYNQKVNEMFTKEGFDYVKKNMSKFNPFNRIKSENGKMLVGIGGWSGSAYILNSQKLLEQNDKSYKYELNCTRNGGNDFSAKITIIVYGIIIDNTYKINKYEIVSDTSLTGTQNANVDFEKVRNNAKAKYPIYSWISQGNIGSKLVKVTDSKVYLKGKEVKFTKGTPLYAIAYLKVDQIADVFIITTDYKLYSTSNVTKEDNFNLVNFSKKVIDATYGDGNGLYFLLEDGKLVNKQGNEVGTSKNDNSVWTSDETIKLIKENIKPKVEKLLKMHGAGSARSVFAVIMDYNDSKTSTQINVSREVDGWAVTDTSYDDFKNKVYDTFNSTAIFDKIVKHPNFGEIIKNVDGFVAYNSNKMWSGAGYKLESIEFTNLSKLYYFDIKYSVTAGQTTTSHTGKILVDKWDETTYKINDYSL